MDEVDPSTRGIIRRYLAKRDDDWHKHEPGVYHASTVWWCLRKNYYMIRGEEQDLPLGLFKMGEKAEDVVEESLADYYGAHFILNSIPVKEEIDTPDGPIAIVGKTDPIIIGYNLEPLRLYEVKSSESYSTKHGEAGSADATHKHQAAWYAKNLGIGDIFIPRPGRSDVLNMPEPDFQIPPGDIPELHAETVEYFVELHYHVTREELPDPDPRHDKECSWCSFKHLCRAEDDGDEGWRRVKAGNGRTVWREPQEPLKQRDKVLT